jgi:hypothetical protein
MYQLKEREYSRSDAHWRDMKIVSAAVLLEGTVYFMDPPARHYNIIQSMTQFLGRSQDYRWEQGFLTDTGDFVRRKPALMIAENAGQLKRKQGPGTYQGPELFSEDLW